MRPSLRTIREMVILDEINFIEEHIKGKCDCWWASPNGEAISKADSEHLIRLAEKTRDERLIRLCATLV